MKKTIMLLAVAVIASAALMPTKALAQKLGHINSQEVVAQARNGPGKILEVIQVQVVAGIESQSAFPCTYRSLVIRFDCLFAINVIVPGIGFRVKFHAVAAAFGGSFDHIFHGIDENGYPYSGILEHPASLFKEVPV